AAGRKMTVEQVDAIAQGRVWTGSEAKNLGLIDEIGGMDAAIKAAAGLAKITDYKTQDFPEYDKSLSELFAAFPFGNAKESMIKNEIGVENYELLQQLRRLTAHNGLQAILPYEININ